MPCFADRLGGVCTRVNGQRSHLRDHPGLLRGLWIQRRLQLAAVVKDSGGGEPLVGTVFTSDTTTMIMVLLFGSCCCYLYDERPSIDSHQTSAILCSVFFFLLPASCWTDTSWMENADWLLSWIDPDASLSCFFPSICTSSLIRSAFSLWAFSGSAYDVCENIAECRVGF